MDYEKAYKEALAKAREIHRNEDEKRFDMEWLFSELKESEDERIRKGLIKGLSAMRDIHHHQTFSDDAININDALAWLEKQGKKKSQRMIAAEAKEALFDYEHANIQQKDFASVGETATIELSSPIDCGDRIYHVSHKPIEKQGEQKPAVIDFNAKDWYVSKVDGKIHDMTYNPADKVEPKFKVKYAGSEYNVLEVKDIAGVTFYGIEDEPNHIDYVKADNCEIISGYGIKENDSPYPTKPSMFSEQKPAWSEEDDYNLQCMIAKVTSDIQKGNVGRNNELIDWLKSLKNRM